MKNLFAGLFSRSRTTDPQTSKDAAESIEPAVSYHYQNILQALLSNGPMGKDGIAYAAGLDANQVSRRLPEMKKLGLIKLTGNTVTSMAGRKEREWDLNV